MEEFVTKAEKRQAKQNKSWNGARMGVRTSTLRAGESLISFEVSRKVKPPKKGKK